VIERIAIILLFNLLFYLKTLGYKYCSDDCPASKRPHSKPKWKHWLFVLESRERHGLQVDHALTILLHAITCVLLYVAFGANDISFIAALLFTVNPATNQGSVWIAGRPYVWPALGMLMVMAFPYTVVLGFALATHYTTGIFAPAILALLPGKFWLIFFMPMFWGLQLPRFWNSVKNKAKLEMFDEDKKIHPKKLILATKTFGFYISLALIPFKNTFYHSFLQSLAGSMRHKGYTLCRFFWIGVIAIISIVAYWVLVPWNLVSFGLLWWCVGIGMFLNFVRIHQEIAERYMYLPTVGLMYVLASAIIGNPYLIGGFLAMYATKMWFYMDAYQDDYYLVEHSCMNSPNSWYAWHLRAMKRWDVNARQEAIHMWVMAKLISPKEFKLLMNISSALRLSGNESEGLKFLAEAEKYIPPGQEKMAGEIIENAKNKKLTLLI